MASALALDHIVLVVGDVETTLAWYRKHLGLGEVRGDDWRQGEAPFPSLRVDEQTIVDVIPTGGVESDGRGHLDHICFVVTPEHLAAAQADPELEVVDEGVRYGARGYGNSIYVHDPDGLTVELRSYPD
jgi:catechol 2,3-dioxygenase-like lactoylglutathione lyase family enzyme